MISVSVVSDKLKINMSLARRAIRLLAEKKLIRPVTAPHSAQWIYTRATQAEETPTA